ncbi:CHAT domain-containing protein [Actinoplanes sp. G11-F43]|uniref:CHAT domain-containing protein n=1 Tax=Actinoplanes sp. G11-F43 TaxID=3424130 RepID=UPI003D34CC13
MRAEDAARRRHRRGVEATSDGRPGDGARHLREGLALLGWHETMAPSEPRTTREALAARLLISLAYAETELGRTDHGFGLLGLAERLVDPDDCGVLLQQRGLMLCRIGRYTEAIGFFDAAIPLLGAPRHATVLCSTLLNRASVHLDGGRVHTARDDLRDCERLARDHDLGMLAAKAAHNRGYCDLLSGDLPGALAAFDGAEELYARHAPGFRPVLSAARARVLLTAGLFTEAGRTLDEVIAVSRRQRITQELAEAELLRSQAALHAGDHTTAATWARRAERRFRRRSNTAWALLAALTRLRADLPYATRPLSVATRAFTVAAGLRAARLRPDAELADLVGVRALVSGGRLDQAADRCAAIPRTPAPVPVELRLMRRLARAELAYARGDRARVAAEAGAGLSALNLHRSRLGSVDMQSGMTVLGQDLAALGLGAAFERGSARAVFAWSERSRAQAFQIPPVHPPDDEEVAAALAELRQLRYRMRTTGQASAARCATLERFVKARSWRVDGPGSHHRIAALGDVQRELAGRILVSFLVRDGRLRALALRDGEVRLIDLGAHGVVGEAVARLSADLDVLAGGGLPAAIEAVIRSSFLAALRIVDEQLMVPMAGWVGDRELVLVPTRQLSGIPWGLLPSLRGRPVTVAASASAWISARRVAVPLSGAGPLLVAGPDLRYASSEVAQVASVYPGSRVLTGSAATVGETLRGLNGVAVAHFAAHGHHERENVLFSCLDLVDGPLMAYDIQQLTVAPRHVVLSACDVGRSVVRPGDEMLGFTAALLYAGTANVVSSVARVSDPVSAEVMTAYHRALASGVPPARALAEAIPPDVVAPFVCFGAG